jgi:hypothetical protein
LRGLAFAGLLLAGAACRGRAQDVAADPIARLVDSLRPAVERATGLSFKQPPRFATRSRAQVLAYLEAKIAQELPPERLAAMRDTYRLLDLIPDSLDLQRLLMSLYEEQVAGFYEPDSGMLFVLAGSDPRSPELRFVVAHELVHALQHQYLPLDSIMKQRWNNDRLAAAQAVLEGQATLASMLMMMPGQDLLADDAVWELFREQVSAARGSMAVFAGAPRIIQEGLLFPYVSGASFMRWWARAHPGEPPPFGSAMPVSTEQVLHPSRYAAGDIPVDLPPADSGARPGESDVLGELEIRILEADLSGADVVSMTVPLGWAGDRYRLYQSREGPALVWLTAWDDMRAAERFRTGTAARLAARPRPGYRTEVSAREVKGHPGVRVVVAPERWKGWAGLN